MYTTSRAHLNPVTSLYELGPHLLSEGVLTGILQELTATRPGSGCYNGGYTCASDGSYNDLLEIESITGCDLKWPFDDSFADLVLETPRHSTSSLYSPEFDDEETYEYQQHQTNGFEDEVNPNVGNIFH
ncbi:hypothetical protein L1987_32626 [Smallanthus sonchifolius]|uniref:Uncharacterized protein n=1 Tax=Smallanthus sonchifolius TaxID=185202 RepID=A0ACB9HNS9_9ASTR|nr:hypothetical protein L1987_32626 [Smallanthus sonchifolius]